MKFLLSILLLVSVSYSQFTFNAGTSYEHDNVFGGSHKVQQIGDAANFLLIYNNDVDGLIKTIAVDGAYAMSTTDSLVYIDVPSRHDLWVIDSTHAIVAYDDAAFDGWIQTFSISTDKATITAIDTLEHNSDRGINPNIRPAVDATHFIITTEDNVGHPWAKVISTDASYDNIANVDSVKIIASNCDDDSYKMERLGTTDVFIFTYTLSGDLRMASVGVAGDYSCTLYDEIVVDSDGAGSAIQSIDNTHVLVAYTDASDNIDAKTYSLDGSYDFTQIDSITVDTDSKDGNYPDLMEFDGHYLVMYPSGSIQGRIRSLDVDGSYDITAQADVITYDNLSTSPSAAEIDATHTIVTFQGVGSDGWMRGLTTTPPAAPGWSHSFNEVSSPTAINAITEWTKINEVE